ncbi:hypothetical protein BDP27DRAFT_484419 [Rhodocollybia butyracea]|uniref:Uncharacterized protein n=1 Tax=Rhodocollybia butyracea TaxID=206335 RepID=A0A9P5Q8V0_9AGAR|nr:hypothetical protein BDP27DRAFT_484419 [Rhodocollybia butyracea]
MCIIVNCLSEILLLLYLLANTESQLFNVAVALNDLRDRLNLPIPDGNGVSILNFWVVINKMTLPVTLLLGDSLVVWRAWTIWPFNRYVQTILIILTALNFGMQIFTITIEVLPSVLFNLLDHLIETSVLSLDQYQVLANVVFNSNDTMGVAVSFLVNVSATFLIGLKAWLHRRDLRKRGFKITKAQQVLLLWIESGFIFGVLQWVCTIHWSGE